MRNTLTSLALFLTASLFLGACGDDGGTTPDGPPAVELTCAAYCTEIAADCTGDNAQYKAGDNSCAESCKAFPTGTAADTSGNTLGCRLYHAKNAMTTGMPATHCPHAGPGGAGANGAATCGDACAGFCQLVFSACQGAANPYASMDECTTACGGFDKARASSATATSGDDYACRLYHATQASIDPTTHCAHVKAVTAQGEPCNGAVP